MQKKPTYELTARPVAQWVSLAFLLGVMGVNHAQETKESKAPAVPPGAASSASAPAAKDAKEPREYKDYKEVTKDFLASGGLIKTHFDAKRNMVLFEIPKDLLGEPLLLVANITAVPPKVDHLGKMANQDVFRFIRRGKRVYLESPSYVHRPIAGQSLSDAVERSHRGSLIASFEVLAQNDQGDPVINATPMFQGDTGEISVRSAIRGGGLASDRSYLKSAKAFPGSVRIDGLQTWSLMAQGQPTGAPVPATPPTPIPGRFGTVEVSYSVVALPKVPMRPRLADDRVGYFNMSRLKFDVTRQGVQDEQIVSRWRLEKKDPSAALSEPVKPLVWYIDPATPPAFVPHVKAGVEAWNKAFEAAGFKNAVQARLHPSKEEDPDFDPEDVRHSLIRWVPSPVPNAYGPHLADPRSGEILNANIVIYHNILQTLRDWYVLQAGAVDPRAKQLPLPDEVMGKMVEYVVTHELGHSLGMPHNMKASSRYPVDKLRDPAWLKEMGHVPSVMDYSRLNYLVQPGDRVDPALLVPSVGPYDRFAIQWGYMPLPQAQTPEQERALLEPLVRQQDGTPWLRFSAPQAQGDDYGELLEAVGDADAVAATELGTKNLQRIVRQLPTMVASLESPDEELFVLYRGVWQQWVRELSHVLAIVGGHDYHNKHLGQPGAIAKPAPAALQRRAVALINQQLFQTPHWLNEPAITERFPIGMFQGLTLGTQRGALRMLLDRPRLARLKLQEDAQADSYTAADMVRDLRQAIFAEVIAGQAVSTPRRHLQRAYVETLAERLAQTGATGIDESRGLARTELRALRSLLVAQAAKGRTGAQRTHLDELIDMSKRALDTQPQSTQTVIAIRGLQEVNMFDDPAHPPFGLGCWHQAPPAP